MTHRFQWSASGATFVQLVAELSWIVVAVILTLRLRELTPLSPWSVLGPAIAFALVMVAVNGAFGLYRRDGGRIKAHVGRLLVATAIGASIAYLTAGHLPGGTQLRDTLDYIVLVAFPGLVVVRLAIVAPLVRHTAAHRLLVLGTGAQAHAAELSLRDSRRHDLELAGFYPLGGNTEAQVPDNAIVPAERTLVQTAREMRIDEIVVAVREQRGGGLPLEGLLDCRLAGVRVTELARFVEAVQGRIPVESLKPSTLIYGEGFHQGAFRTAVKRSFDVAVVIALLPIVLPIAAVTALLIALEGGGPVIYRQERVGLRGNTFSLMKFRSMHNDAEKDGKPRWATVGDARVTRLGKWLRRTRIDELPQLFNVLTGEMSFVGPRPERPAFVAMLAKEIPFYAARSSIKPGLTGWAQVRYSYGASVEQSLRKLEYDLYYVKNHSLLLDCRILVETVRVVLSGEGAR
jgi:sugar transferase (PEP-CTERM system associated)